MASGDLTPDQFLEVNAEVGSWKDSPDMVPEVVPFEDLDVVIGRIAAERGITPEEVLAGIAAGVIPVTDLFDPWSSNNANVSPDGGTTPAERRSGDLEAIEAAYDTGLIFGGDLPREIPIIDVRDYLEPVLDMHNSHQSFAARQRLLDGHGHADNQVIWFAEADEDGNAPAGIELTHAALDTVAEWMATMAADPSLSVSDAKPVQASDLCVDVAGEIIASGEGVWDGILDDGPDGACAERFPPFSTSRIEAGGPITGDVYKCQLMPVETALAENLYGTWQPGDDDVARLREIFSEGVCDYDLPGVGDPAADDLARAPIAIPVGRLVIVLAERGTTVELRSRGEVVRSKDARGFGIAVFPRVDEGTYVVRAVDDGRPGHRSDPFDVHRFRFRF